MVLFGLGLLAADITTYAEVRDDGPADAAIVLGAAIWGDQPSPVFRERINHAVDLYERGAVQKLIFTGGFGEGEAYAESEVARIYAIEAGVSVEDIAIETRSRTTYQNLTEAHAIIQTQGLGRVLIVSDPLHMRRAVTMARDVGLDAHPSPTPTTRYRSWWTKARFLLRELYFYSSYLFARSHGETAEIFQSSDETMSIETL